MFYQAVFKRYRDLANEQLWWTDDDRLQAWVVYTSVASGLNLAPFYQGWGWQLKTGTFAATASLPAWTGNPMLLSPPAPPPSPSPPLSPPPLPPPPP